MEVRCRKKRHFTTTSYGNQHPLWDDTIDFQVTDPSTILVVNIWDEGLLNNAILVGRWRMTMKYLVSAPTRCYHGEDFRVEHSASGVQISGWFPLLVQKYMNPGCPGQVRMEISWTHDPGFQDLYEPSPFMSALNQVHTFTPAQADAHLCLHTRRP